MLQWYKSCVFENQQLGHASLSAVNIKIEGHYRLLKQSLLSYFEICKL